MTKKRRITENDLADIQNMVDQGKTVEEIAEHYGYCKCSICRIITTKLNREYRGKVCKNDVKLFKTMVEEGSSRDEIAKMLGISASTVTRFAKKQNLKITNKHKYKQQDIEFLQCLWNDLKLSTKECAVKFGTDFMRVNRLVPRLRNSGYYFERRRHGRNIGECSSS